MRVILFGYYGYGNAGDEAVLAGLLTGLRTFGPEQAQYIVLSGNPAETTRVHGVDAFPRNDWRALVEESGRADAWIFGGGSLLQDVSGPFTLPFYLGVLSLLVLRKQRVFIHAHGIGPIESPLNRRLTARLMQKMTRISLRDPISYQLLQSFGVSADRLHLGADLAFLLDPIENAPASQGDKPLIGLSVRSWPGEDGWLDNLIAGLRAALSEIDARLFLIPMDDARDRMLAERIAAAFGREAMVGKANASYRERMHWLARCELIVAMRLHAGVLAATAGVPGLLLSYDPKVDALAELLGWPCLPIEALATQDVRDALRELWVDRSGERQRLGSRVAELTRLAEDDLFGLIHELTQEAPGRLGSVRS